MRALLKLTGACAVALAMQLLIGLPDDAFDEMQFTLRVQLASLRGMPLESPELLDAADQLLEKQTGLRVSAYLSGESVTPLNADENEPPGDGDDDPLALTDLDCPPGHL